MYCKFIKSYPDVKMKANHKQTAVKLTASKIGTHVMIRVIPNMVNSAYTK